MNPLHTIGYSTWQFEDFAQTLRAHQITVVCDVRSSPFSKRNPAFSRRELETNLRELRIKYVFLGEGLGARPNESECYVNGQARYELLAKRPAFKADLARIVAGLERHRPVILCAEREPLDCHRTILVCRHLIPYGIDIRHVMGSGGIETHSDLEHRLVRALGLEPPPMFATPTDWRAAIEQAYEIQGRKIAYVGKPDSAATDSTVT